MSDDRTPQPPKFWHLAKHIGFHSWGAPEYAPNGAGILFWFTILGQFSSWILPVYAYAVHAWWARWFP